MALFYQQIEVALAVVQLALFLRGLETAAPIAGLAAQHPGAQGRPKAGGPGGSAGTTAPGLPGRDAGTVISAELTRR
jgi:hypothetical protein